MRRERSRATRALPWLVLGLMLLAHHAVAAKGDVKDTHQRLDRIYGKLGIKEPAQRSDGEGCGSGREEQKPEQQKESHARRPAPRMPAWLGYLLIGVILAAMLIPLAFVLKNSFSVARGDPGRALDGEEPVEEGPAAERGPWVVDLSECRRLIAQGRHAEAFAALHRLTLLGLERMHHLALDETTTNWEYVRRLVSRPELRRVLAAVTVAAERSVLGQRPPGPAHYGELERMVLEHVHEGRA